MHVLILTYLPEQQNTFKKNIKGSFHITKVSPLPCILIFIDQEVGLWCVPRPCRGQILGCGVRPPLPDRGYMIRITSSGDEDGKGVCAHKYYVPEYCFKVRITHLMCRIKSWDIFLSKCRKVSGWILYHVQRTATLKNFINYSLFGTL